MNKIEIRAIVEKKLNKELKEFGIVMNLRNPRFAREMIVIAEISRLINENSADRLINAIYSVSPVKIEENYYKGTIKIQIYDHIDTLIKLYTSKLGACRIGDDN